MRSCSKNRLRIAPSGGWNVSNGVTRIILDTNIQGLYYTTVKNLVKQKLDHNVAINKYGPSFDPISYVYVMPDAVNFNGAAGYGGLFNNVISVKDRWSDYPIVSVHEYGHLMGQSHSGAYVNGVRDSYGDNTDYMGGRLDWTPTGTEACFNAAKLWYFNWFTPRHVVVRPLEKGENMYLTSLDDVVNTKTLGVKMIAKVEGDYNKFFVMFNRVKGINSGQVIGMQDEVVITQQNGESRTSWTKKGLKEGESWVYNNFGGQGKNLIIKVCSISLSDLSDKAKVLIYIDGRNNQQC
jgi:hypothetical protein